MKFTINLEQYIKNIIKSQINNVGLVELGRLRYELDLYLAAGPDNLEFEPVEITEEGILETSYLPKNETYHRHLYINIKEVIREQERELENEQQSIQKTY